MTPDMNKQKWPVVQKLEALKRPAVLAHRGSYVKGDIPENTLPAFERAIELGADGFEIDVRMTRDGQLLVYHDSSLIRFFNSSQKIRKLRLEDLKQLRFKSETHPERINIPTLDELLANLNKKFLINIEVKKDKVDYELLAGKLYEIITKFDFGDNVWISSFDAKFLQIWLKQNSNIPAALLFDCFKPLSRRQIKKEWAEWLHPGVRLLEYFPKFAETGKPVCVWTVNQQADLEACRKLGVQAVITDNVPTALQILCGEKEAADG